MPEVAAPVRARPFDRLHVSLTITILTAFSLVFLAVMGAVAFATYRETARLALQAAGTAMTDLSLRTEARAEALLIPVTTAVAVATPPALLAPGEGAAMSPGEAALRDLLAALPDARAVEVADAEGRLLQAIDAAGLAPARAAALDMPKGAKLALRAAPPGRGGEQTWRFFDSGGAFLGQRTAPAEGDVRDEIWFRTARNSQGVGTTVLHLLPATGRAGLTLVRALKPGGALGVDLGLDSIAALLDGQRLGAHGATFLIDDLGILLAHSNPAIAMESGAQGAWITIASSKDPILRAVWHDFSTGRLAAGRQETIDVGGEAVMVRLLQMRPVDGAGFIVGVAAPVSDFTGGARAMRDNILLIFAVAGIAGCLLIAAVAARVSHPLAALTQEAAAIGRFELDRPVAVASHIAEVDALAGTMRAMKQALRLFGLYVPKDLVRQLVDGDGQVRLGGERRDITVMFTDVVGFTTIADGMDATELTRVTSAYFEGMTVTLMATGATIDKYIGDAIMALWNAPSQDDAHARHACLAALRARALCDRLARTATERGEPVMRTRFGINTGEAALGNVGSSDRMSYTAIGATVNLASRLEGLNKHYGTQILVGADTRAAAGDAFVFRRVDRVLPKGQVQPADIHELLGLRRAMAPMDGALVLTAEDVAWARNWDGIVAAWRERRFDDARALLRVAALRPDPLADLYARRLEAVRANPPPADWDGVAAFAEK